MTTKKQLEQRRRRGGGRDRRSFEDYVDRGIDGGDVSLRFTYYVGTRDLSIWSGFKSVVSMNVYLPLMRQDDPPPQRPDWGHLADDWIVIGKDVRASMDQFSDAPPSRPAPALRSSPQRGVRKLREKVIYDHSP